jgi:4-aminobutyrate aminotransferase
MQDQTARMIGRDAAALLGQDLSLPCQSSVRRAEGIWIEDHAGRRFMDFHGNSAHHLGYAHPRVLAAIRDQLDRLTFAPRRFACEPATELAERLGQVAPGDLSKCLSLPSGSDAIETALRLARAATGRWKMVSFWGSCHGSGFGAAAVGGDPVWRHRATGPLPTGAEHVPQ